MKSKFVSRAFELPTFSSTSDRKSVAQSPPEPRKYQYETLTQVDIFNTFYNESGDKCEDFRIYPTATTQSIVNSLGLIFRETSTGFSVLYDSTREAGLIKYLKSRGTGIDDCQYWSKLSFIVALHNPLFVNFTDLPFNVDLTARNIYLSNETAHQENDEIILNKNDYVSPRHEDFIEIIPTKYAVASVIHNNGKSFKATRVTVTNVSGEIVLSVPNKSDKNTDPKNIDTKKPDDIPNIVYLSFATLPEGLYTISWLENTGEDRNKNEVEKIIFEKRVIYTTAYPTSLCFIDLFFSRPTQDSTGIYPIEFNSKNDLITSVSYHLKFKARDIHWVYRIVSASQPVENMRIKSDGRNEINFHGPTQSPISTGETAWSFVSDRVIAMRERSPLRFKLVDRLNCQCESPCNCKSRIVVNPLPLVSSNQILNGSLEGTSSRNTIKNSGKKKYSEVFVYV